MFKQVFWAKLIRRATALAVPIRTLSWFIFSHFVAIRSWSVRRRRKSQKNTKTPYFGDSRSFKITDVNKNIKLVTSFRYNKQHVYAHLQLFSR